MVYGYELHTDKKMLLLKFLSSLIKSFALLFYFCINYMVFVVDHNIKRFFVIVKVFFYKINEFIFRFHFFLMNFMIPNYNGNNFIYFGSVLLVVAGVLLIKKNEEKVLKKKKF